MRFPGSIERLINEFTKLPTVGPKTAERFVFSLLKKKQSDLDNLSEAIKDLLPDTKVCQNCLMITDKNLCPICSDNKRDDTQLCIVADSRDIISIENTKQYQGRYFVLGGLLNTIEGIKPEDLNMAKLIARIKKGGIKEIILALNPNIEGETTCLYLSRLFKDSKIKITRLAKGLPTGSDIEYADEITLASALKYRNEIK